MPFFFSRLQVLYFFWYYHEVTTTIANNKINKSIVAIHAQFLKEKKKKTVHNT